MGFERMLKDAMTNKYVLYVVLFLAITNVVGYLASQDYDSLVFFVITGFLTSYFSDNMTVVLLAALVVSNVFLASRQARVVREGMDHDGKDKKDKKGKKDKKDKNDKKDEEKDDGKEGDEAGEPEGTEEKKTKTKEKYSGMQKLSPAAIGEDIDVKATNDANFGEVEAELSASDMNDLNAQTDGLKSAQADLHKQIKAMGPLMDSAQKMMTNMGGMEGLTGMMNQANAMMGSLAPMMDKLNMSGAKTDIAAEAAPVKEPATIARAKDGTN